MKWLIVCLWIFTFGCQSAKHQLQSPVELSSSTPNLYEDFRSGYDLMQQWLKGRELTDTEITKINRYHAIVNTLAGGHEPISHAIFYVGESPGDYTHSHHNPITGNITIDSSVVNPFFIEVHELTHKKHEATGLSILLDPSRWARLISPSIASETYAEHNAARAQMRLATYLKQPVFEDKMTWFFPMSSWEMLREIILFHHQDEQYRQIATEFNQCRNVNDIKAFINGRTGPHYPREYCFAAIYCMVLSGYYANEKDVDRFLANCSDSSLESKINAILAEGYRLEVLLSAYLKKRYDFFEPLAKSSP